MKTLLMIFLVTLLAAGGGYAYLWHDYASEIEQSLDKVQQEIAKLNEQSGNKGMELSVGKMEVTGFPMQLNIDIEDFSMIVTGQVLDEADVDLEKIAISYPEQVRFSADMFGTDMYLNMPSIMDIILTGQYGEEHLRVKMNDAVMSMSLQHNHFISLITNGKIFPDKPDMTNVNFDYFKYKDNGGSLVKVAGSEEIPFMSYGDNYLLLDLSEQGGEDIKFDIKGYSNGMQTHDAYMDFVYDFWSEELTDYEKTALKYFKDFNRHVGANDVTFDISYTGQDPSKVKNFNQFEQGTITIDDITNKNQHIATQMQGQLNFNKSEDPMPYGNISVKLTNYPEIINSNVVMLNMMISTMKDEMANGGLSGQLPINVDLNLISPESVEMFSQLLTTVFEVGPTEKDLVMNITREKGGDLKIGKSYLGEVMMLGQALVMPKDQQIPGGEQIPGELHQDQFQQPSMQQPDSPVFQ